MFFFEQTQHTHTTQSSPLRKILTFIMTLVIIGLALMFSAVLLVIILTVGAIAGSYLWWKTRGLRKQMREYAQNDAEMRGTVFDSVVVERTTERNEAIQGEIIEGEIIRSIESDKRD